VNPAITATPSTGQREIRWRWLNALLHLLVATALGIGGYWLEQLRAELERRPPVAIIEVAALAPPAAGADPAAATAALRLATRRLAAAGYVVLDSQAVLAAPSDLYVPPPAWVPDSTLPGDDHAP